MTQKIQIPLIHPKNMQENINDNKLSHRTSSISDTKRESLLFPGPRKRRFFESESNNDFDMKKDDLKGDKFSIEKSTDIRENIHNEKRKDIKVKNTSLDLLEKFLYLDEKFNDFDGFPYLVPFVRNIINTNEVSSYAIKKKIPYPEYLISSFQESFNNEEKCFVLTGINENLNLVYFTKDNIIYLWNYITDEIITYDQINSTISAIHITKPKAKFFSDEISHIIIVATNISITILLIKQNDNEKINIIKSDFYVELEINYIVTCIASTAQRRIFLGSQNNFLFELDYTKYHSTIFGPTKKLFCKEKTNESLLNKLLPDFLNLKTYSYCSKLVVDDTRNILYALIHTIENKERIFDIESVYNSEVKYFSLGVNGKDFKEIGTIKQNEIKDRDRDSANQNDKNYVILDIFASDRSESKYFDLVAVTKLGLRAYISFDYVEKAIKLNPQEVIYNFNLIYKIPKRKSFFIYLKNTPEPSINLIIDTKEKKSFQNQVKEDIFYDQITYIDKSFFVFFHDKLKNCSHLDLIEQDQSMGIKTHLENYEKKSVENISKLMSLEDNKKISFIVKRNPQSIYPNFLSLMRIENEEYITNYFYSTTKYINYQDSFDHYSNCSMHIYANQQFLKMDEFIISTSNELILFGKLRPIDQLYEMIHENMSNEDIFWNQLQKFINEHTLYETTYMILVIICNKNFTFYRRNLKKEEIIEDKNYEQIIEFCKMIYLKITLKSENSNNISKKNVPYQDNLINIIGEPFRESQSIKINNISYSLYMYLARISRLFINENIFMADTYNDNYFEGFSIEQLKVNKIN